MSLFGSTDDSGAVLAGDPDPRTGERPLRYRLWRKVGEGPRRVGFIMLNPSTADHEQNDPTVRRCIAYARDWGYGYLEIGNLFAFRTPSIGALRSAFFAHQRVGAAAVACPPVVGPDNDRHLAAMAKACDLLLAAWGTNGSLGQRGGQVVTLLQREGITMRVLSTNNDGSPGHPLYLPASRKPIVWANLPTPYSRPAGRGA